jgi:hypothetical protein
MEKLIHNWCFFNEAWFSLRAEVNSQNNWYWRAENPRFIHELPLPDEEIGVWCAINACRIIGTIFYNDTVNALRYVNNILRPFLSELREEERLYGVLQQDSATAHTAYKNFDALRDVFGDHIISRGLWHACSPDLTPFDFYL